MAQNLPPKVTLDDLLRLKRAERPSAEFWTRFEEELRAKQLAALVKRRPWWADAGLRLRTAFARFGLPLGAATTLALAGLLFRAFQPAAIGPAVAITSKQDAAASGPARPAKPIPAPAQAPIVSAASAPTPGLATPAAPKPAELFASTSVEHPVAGVPLTPWTTSISADSAQPVLQVPNTASPTGALAVADLPSAALGTTATVPGAAAAAGSEQTVASVPTSRPASDQTFPARLLALNLRPDEMPLVSAEAQVLEQFTHRIPDELLHTATRHMVGLDGGTVQVRF
jgi:hypothetical protein